MSSFTRYFLPAAIICFCSVNIAVAGIDQLLEHYRYLHQHPELSLQENNTSAYLAKQLEESGYEFATGIGGHGLVAKLRNEEGPVIMFRADMDALPIEEETGLPYSSKARSINRAGNEVPVMHACGHDIHMTVMLGIAQQMAADKAKWKGSLLLVAEPAEEIGAGSRAMIADGLYDRFPVPDYNLAFHASPDLSAGQVGYVSGYSMANVDSVDITIFGVGGHGAYPHKTKDPIVIASQIILALQTIVSRELSPLESAVVTVGSIHGGTKHNIIPGEVRMQLTVRSYWPTSPSAFELKTLAHGKTEGGYFYASNAFCTPEHGGTHMDAPIHFGEGRHSVDEIPVERLVAPAVVIDVSEAAAKNPDYVLAPADIERWENTHGRIPEHTIVVLRTGWESRWSDVAAYLGDDMPGDASNLHFPSFGAEAAEFLVKERNIAGIGVDTASIDNGPSRDFMVHRITAAANVYGLENLMNLGRLPAMGATIIALPMKIAGGSGAPVRVIAMLP